MKTQTAEQTAHQNAKLKVEFRIHLVTYILVNSFLAIMNITLTPEYLWFIWPLLGWGVGLILHGVKVRYSANPGLKDRMIEMEMEKQRKQTSMRKVYTIISFMVLTAGLQAQAPSTYNGAGPQSETGISGFGGPLFSATQLNHDFGLAIGGKGGAVFNEKLAFGGLGYGIVTPLEFNGNNLSEEVNTPLEMTFGAGGVFFEYILNYGDRVQFSFPLHIMAGGVNIHERNTDNTEIESSAFFLLEPGLNIDFNLSDYYTQTLFVTYRLALGSSLMNIQDGEISGLNVGLLFKFIAK